MSFEERLARLRAKYQESGAADIHDPLFKRVADTVFDPSGRRVKPYSGVSTFLDAPHRPAPVEGTVFGDLEVALVGVPMDLGVTNRPGARFGPRAVRQMERIGPYHHVFRSAPVNEHRVADIGDVPFESRYSLEQSIRDIEAFYKRLHASPVAVLFPESESAMERAADKTGALFVFLFGGPHLYQQRHGSPRMRMRHLPFQIAPKARADWLRCLRRRSQRHKLTWRKMMRIAERWLPSPKLRHPYPDWRFDVMTRGRSPVR